MQCDTDFLLSQLLFPLPCMLILKPPSLLIVFPVKEKSVIRLEKHRVVIPDLKAPSTKHEHRTSRGNLILGPCA